MKEKGQRREVLLDKVETKVFGSGCWWRLFWHVCVCVSVSVFVRTKSLVLFLMFKVKKINCINLEK